MYFSTGLAYAHMYTCVEVQLFFTAVMLIPVAEDKGHQIAAFMLVCVCPSYCHTIFIYMYVCSVFVQAVCNELQSPHDEKLQWLKKNVISFPHQFYIHLIVSPLSNPSFSLSPLSY